ncbi:polysialyltransferase family glycosyltransferase [Microbacterium sp.]|uniref:polysialyltransferase family glycosyltransferase n=1 Tax=Microbacterium sp. TaxID=51671 RepID=UPI0028114E50|nr:polysialyltransferase family glycosyltransferase [Microbacterium sp.]
MIQIFALHSGYGLMTAAAAIDAGLLGAPQRRILVTMNTAAVPETAVDIGAARFAPLHTRFDAVEALNPLIDPRHPTAWHPEPQDLPMLERLFTRAWGIDETDVELFVQSPQVAPARTLMALFSLARLGVIGDGLMTYSPIRDRLPRLITERVERVIHPDVVPGVQPLVFAETGAARVPVPPAAFAAVLHEVGDARPDAALDALAADGAPTALVIGQYLAALGLVSAAEESAMQTAMIDTAADAGARRVVFKPHPSAPPALTAALRRRADERGVAFAVYTGDQPAEYVAHRLRATDAVAVFSTALPTLSALYGTRIHGVGLDTVLRRLQPYENSNRIPATIVDALTRPGDAFTAPGRMQHLVDTVGYAMQPRIVGHLRPRAEDFLSGLSAAERERLVPADRLRALGLPGAPPPTRIGRVLASGGGIGRLDEFALTAQAARRRVRRTWKAVTGR